MKISQQMKAELAKVAEHGVEVTINGFNEYGQTFTTKGKILMYKGKPMVYDNGLAIDFRDEHSKDKREIPSLSCQFIVDIKPEQSLFDLLIVSSIALPNGTVLLENRSANTYMKRAQQNAKRKLEQIEKEGRSLDPMDPVTKAAQQYIGKPFYLSSGDTGSILLHCIECTNSGESIAGTCSRVSEIFPAFISEKSILFERNENGDLEPVERNSASANYNDIQEAKKVFDERAERIASIKASSSQPQGPND